LGILQINGALLKEMAVTAAAYLEAAKERVDTLNVFPVPDGDTGTNMSLTLSTAAREAGACPSASAGDVAEAFAHGALKGARGNSGVILSQLLRGFANAVKGCSEIAAPELAQALRGAVNMAYKAVMKPREGTILTVSRGLGDAAWACWEAGETDLSALLSATIEAGNDVLSRTPDMLPVLKEAGVVDAGGQGLIIIFQGFLAALNGDAGDLDMTQFTAPAAGERATADEVAAFGSVDDIEFTYCTEFMIINMPKAPSAADMDMLRTAYSRIGDCVVVVGDDSLIKVHTHTNDPGALLTRALTLGGELTNLKIENMKEQFRQVHSGAAKAAPARDYAIVTVAAGDGLREIFDSLSVSGFVEGGQTMNPSTDDILGAINAQNAKRVFVLPNNSNIIMAAQQAAELASCEVAVIPTKTVPQGIAAVLAFDQAADMDTNAANMTEAIERVKTGQVTYAVRESGMNGHTIQPGDIIGLFAKDIIASGSSIADVSLATMAQMIDDDSEIVSIYFGADTTEDDAQALADMAMERWPHVDVEVYYGGQPVYYYIISAE